MPTIDAPSYDQFDLEHYDEEPLLLDEASRKAAEMRKKTPGNIYRVTVANARGDRFYVNVLSPIELYTDILSRLSARWAGMLSSTKSRHVRNG